MNALTHAGIRGMKWGRRRYQNPDGSLTPEGKKRYGSGKSDLSEKSDAELAEVTKRSNLEKAYRRATGEDGNPLDKRKKLLDAAKNETDSLRELERRVPSKKPKKLMDLASMSDKDMRDAINRKLLEKQYRDMFDNVTVSRGRERLRTVLEVGGATIGVSSSALGIALAIKELRG